MEMLLSSIVNTHMPTKKMRVRAQDVPYMTKEWKGTIRAKRRAAKKYLKEQTSENWEARRITRNEATRLRRKAIRTYWKEQATKLKCKPSEFYKTFMPFLTDKHKVNSNELSLSINGTICRDQCAVSNHLCEYFATVADGIGDTRVIDDKVLVTHPSVQNITQKMTGYQGFQFQNLQSLSLIHI